MRKALEAKYGVKINKSNSSYGNYCVRFSNSHLEFFWKISDIAKFLENHLKDLKSGNRL